MENFKKIIKIVKIYLKEFDYMKEKKEKMKESKNKEKIKQNKKIGDIIVLNKGYFLEIYQVISK